ncbi:MAG: glycosyltransferase family 2 protein, partial [Acidobacteria bacterium]|nr:glycosyltransferase family 2 protein [Acidobacteriota bacterium]
IPTHNRPNLLARTLAALGRQSWPATGFEVLVVADACEDQTAAAVASHACRAPYHLELLSHDARSAAASRNLGAAGARGHVLLFLDDDVEPQPDLIGAHMAAVQPRTAVLGYSKPTLPANPALFQLEARRWWEDTFTEMARPGHRFTYRDFFSGNLSMFASLFREAGGFDTSFSGRLEDYELGFRLLKGGCRFHFERGAAGYHFDTQDLSQWLCRQRQEGAADVRMGHRHPELRSTRFLNFEQAPGRHLGRVRSLAFASLPLLERWGLRRRWRQIVATLREYEYWSGVAQETGGRRALAAWVQESPGVPSIAPDAPCVDVAALPADGELRRVLELGTAKGLRIALCGVELTGIPPQVGAEPLREIHVRSALAALQRTNFIPMAALRMAREQVLC